MENNSDARRRAELAAREQARVAEQNRLLALPAEQHTLATIEQISSDNYRNLISANPAFAKRVDELEAARAPRPRMGMGGENVGR